MSQSTNDSVPTAIHIAALTIATDKLLPALDAIIISLGKKAKQFKGLNKTGRTHLRDAVSLTLGQEFSGYESELVSARSHIKTTLKELHEVALGGTAIGSGLNTPRGYTRRVVKELEVLTKLPLKPARNHFESVASHDRVVMFSGSLKVLAVAVMKISNDIRWLSSGPNTGLAEINIPENEPGSSIMPGKVNPTQSEALMLVASQVIGNDVAITTASTNLSNFELAVSKPLLANTIVQSTTILADAIASFDKHCVRGITANKEQLEAYATASLTDVTQKGRVEGYDVAAGSSKKKK